MFVAPRGFEPVVFVIGPMGKGKGLVGGVDVGDHIGNLEKALATVRQEFVDAGNQAFAIHTPEGAAAHDINAYVLRNIDQCDIGVADLSDRSPNVFYELSFMHALGIPVITFDLSKKAGGQGTPWYGQTRIVNLVDDFEVPTLVKELRRDLTELLLKTPDEAVFSNPISQNYEKVALVDASAAAGLAIGQFTNFILHALHLGGPLAPRRGDGSGRPVEVVILKPEVIADVEGAENRAKSALPFKREEISVPTRSRPLVYTRFKDIIVDFPTPLLSLRSAPRYRRIAQFVKDDRPNGILPKMERRWIETYFDTLTYLVRVEKTIHRDRLRYLSEDEIYAL